MTIAIVKPIKIRRGDNGGLKYILDYIKNTNKTNGGELIFGWNCRKDYEFQDMLRTKKLYGKTSGRQYVHFVQSFHDKNPITPELAFQIGREYIAALKQWQDFQVAMAVHTDTEHMHIHYVINSVNCVDGSKWQCSKQDLKHFREQSDELCRKYNLHVLEQGNRGHQHSGEYRANQNGGSWKQKLAADIAECMEQATSRADFHHLLNERGIEADIGSLSTLFTIRVGVYGLKKEMSCGDKKLQTYGDFSAAALEKHFADIPTLQNMTRNLADNPSLLMDAMYDLGQMFSTAHEDMLDRFHNRTMTPLEGRALKDWILKHKDRAFEANSTSWVSQSNEHDHGYEM